MILFDQNIWPAVRKHPWKFRARTQQPRFVELHCTRSGIVGRTPREEFSATINWSLSTYNRNNRAGDDWASMESFIVGGGQTCRVLDDGYYPHYSLGHADPFAFSIEIGQNLDGTPFDPRDIDNAARICASLSEEYDIPVYVIPWLDAHNNVRGRGYGPIILVDGAGYVRHDRSDNGSYYGKSDPGWVFNDREFELKVRAYMGAPSEEEHMASAEYTELKQLITDQATATQNAVRALRVANKSDVQDLLRFMFNTDPTQGATGVEVQLERRVKALEDA